jgi:hypothetical protein
MVPLVVGTQTVGQDKDDPHRPPCTSAGCKRIKSFLKARYCGESPAGNGPEDGCDIRTVKNYRSGVNVKADFDCEWKVASKPTCQQRGEPSPKIRDFLLREMRRLGLPSGPHGEIYFTVWETPSADWSLAHAYYTQETKGDRSMCEVTLMIDRNSKVHLVRQLPLQKIHDDPSFVTWTPIDLADANGDGQLDVILRGDAYENHWLEVVSLQNGKFETIFSGLGYYL